MRSDPLEIEGDGSLVDEIRLVSFSVCEGGNKKHIKLVSPELCDSRDTCYYLIIKPVRTQQ